VRVAATTPVTDAERERIRQLHARGMTCGEIAAELGRNKSTVTRQCKKLGLSFDRAQTDPATSAKNADVKARRAEAKVLMMDDWHRFRERLWSSYDVVLGTGTGAEVITLDLPPAQDARALTAAMSTLIKDQIAIEKHDVDAAALSDVDAWLAWMSGEDG
jgi:Helix-turn-helix domain